ncbi:hypothetical protein ACFE04_019314 [Oxalis oulophora]
MKLLVEFIDYQRAGFFYIDLPDDEPATVGDLKEAIATKESRNDLDRMILVLKDSDQQFTNDEALLLDCGVENGSHIFLSFCNVPKQDFGSGSSMIGDKNHPIVIPDDTPSDDNFFPIDFDAPIEVDPSLNAVEKLEEYFNKDM